MKYCALLKDDPPPAHFRVLKSVFGKFAYYTKSIDRFADKICPLTNSKAFLTIEDENALKAFQKAFQMLKQALENAPR